MARSQGSVRAGRLSIRPVKRRASRVARRSCWHSGAITAVARSATPPGAGPNPRRPRRVCARYGAHMDWPMRFGVFLAPFNPVGQNPTVALEKDLELVEWMDRWGFDEAWIGEHHSGGYEIIASPEVFIGV